MKRKCLHCNGIFIATRYQVKKGRARFCSLQCYGKSIYIERIEIKCKHCHKLFFNGLSKKISIFPPVIFFPIKRAGKTFCCHRTGRKILAMTSEHILKFPAGFLWGTATSPTQVEGHVANEWTNYVAADGGHCRGR